jgi:hypothetical protein
MLFASFNQGFSLWGFVLIPLLFAAPIVLMILQFRSLSRSEPLSKTSWTLLILGALFLSYFLRPWHLLLVWRELRGIWLGLYLLGALTAVASVPILGWEAYKNGWFARRSNKRRKNGRKPRQQARRADSHPIHPR